MLLVFRCYSNNEQFEVEWTFSKQQLRWEHGDFTDPSNKQCIIMMGEKNNWKVKFLHFNSLTYNDWVCFFSLTPPWKIMTSPVDWIHRSLTFMTWPNNGFYVVIICCFLFRWTVYVFSFSLLFSSSSLISGKYNNRNKTNPKLT